MQLIRSEGYVYTLCDDLHEWLNKYSLLQHLSGLFCFCHTWYVDYMGTVNATIFTEMYVIFVRLRTNILLVSLPNALETSRSYQGGDQVGTQCPILIHNNVGKFLFGPSPTYIRMDINKPLITESWTTALGRSKGVNCNTLTTAPPKPQCCQYTCPHIRTLIHIAPSVGTSWFLT